MSSTARSAGSVLPFEGVDVVVEDVAATAVDDLADVGQPADGEARFRVEQVVQPGVAVNRRTTPKT